MKFTQYLLSRMVPEWVKLYLNFKLLKTYLSSSTKLRKRLKSMKKLLSDQIFQERKNELMTDPEIIDKLNKDSQQFVEQFRREILKVESFTLYKYQDIRQKLGNLTKQLKAMKHSSDILYQQILRNYKKPLKDLNKRKTEFQNKQYILKQSFYNFFVEIQQFQSYSELNYTAIIKILKKYKKQVPKSVRKKETDDETLVAIAEELQVLKQIPFKTKEYSAMIEKDVINNFYPTNAKKCRYHLRKYTEDKKLKNDVYFKFGLFVGIAFCLVLLILIIRYEGLLDTNSNSGVFAKLFPCFRGLALLLIYYWYISLDLVGWNYFRINYKIYLGFNHHFSTVPEVLKRVSWFTAFFLILFVLYILQTEEIFKILIPTELLPVILWGVFFIYIFTPTRTEWNGAGRRWMYRMLYGAWIGHFFKYESRYTFFLDQMISMVIPMRDIDYTFCYYYHIVLYFYLQKIKQWGQGVEMTDQCYYNKRLSGALIAIIPYSMKCIHYITRARDKGKFWQTDEMWNFFKTLLAVAVGTLSYLTRLNNSYKIAWIVVAIFCSLAQYWWDLKKDFLFFEPGTKIRFLRNDLGFNNPYIYYTLAVFNFFLRLTWILSISQDMYTYLGINNRELFILLVGFLEMTRRLINNFLKIEKEYITNLRALRNTGDLSYPFEFRDSMEQIIKEDHSLSTLKTDKNPSYINVRLSKVRDSLDDQLDLMSSKALFKYKGSTELERFFGKDYDMNIINQAKNEEKFKLTQIKNIKRENEDFQTILDEKAAI